MMTKSIIFMVCTLIASNVLAIINTVDGTSSGRFVNGNIVGDYVADGIDTPVPVVSASVLFEENFDVQADWTPTGTDCSRVSPEKCNAGVPDTPTDWSYYRCEDLWNPGTGNPSHNYCQRISSEQGRGGSGKAWIKSSESSHAEGESNYHSDAILMKEFTAADGFDAAGYEEMYISFYLRFDPTWQFHTNGATGGAEFKLVRMGHIDAGNDLEVWQLGSTGNTAPFLLYQMKHSDMWGFRGHHEPRCDAQNPNYYCDNDIGQDPLYICPVGQTCTGNGTVGGQPQDDPTFAEMFYPGQWIKFEYYMKLNSAPGVSDGIYKHWVGDVLQHSKTDLQWRYSDSDASVKLNFFSIGGNWNNFIGDPLDKTEQEYAIDDIQVCSTERCVE